MKYNEWLHLAQTRIKQALTDCYKKRKINGWSENYLTTEVLDTVQDIGLDLKWDDCNQWVKWESYKLSGALESKFGDIALFARIWLSEGHFIDGVAFYEAKRQYFDDDWKPKGFKAVDFQQLSRINEATYSSNVLLYDVNIKSGKIYVTSIPTPFVRKLSEAKAITKSGAQIHGFGNPWVKALGDNLRGFGLDFRVEAIDAIKSQIETGDGPSVVLNVGVGFGELEPELDPYFAALVDYELRNAEDDSPSQSLDNDLSV